MAICQNLFACVYLIMPRQDFLDGEIQSNVFVRIVPPRWERMTASSPGSVCVDVCYLKLVRLWLVPNHNTGIAAQPVTHTLADMQMQENTAYSRTVCTHGHSYIYTQLQIKTCLPTHAPAHAHMLMWKLLLYHITGNEPVHMSLVSFKVRERRGKRKWGL